MPIYMKYEGVQGPVTGKYAGWIELDSCQIGVHRAVNSPPERTGNREATAPSISEIVVTKYQDSSSTALFKESLGGEVKKVTIVFVRGEDAPYLSIELENTLVSSYSISGSGGDPHAKPMESLSLNFTKISYSTTPTAATKDPKATKDRAMWDFLIK